MKIEEKIYLIIKKVIDEWDPAWLLEDGAPEDEYDFESKEIADNIMNINNVELLKKYIYELFLKMFGDDTKTKAKNLYECEKIADLILIDIKNIDNN